VEPRGKCDLNSLQHDAFENNKKLVEGLREDKNASVLLDATKADAEKGRMTEPIEIIDDPPMNVRLVPRFSAEQVRDDGTIKIRPVDHFSWSAHGHHRKDRKKGSINGHTVVGELIGQLQECFGVSDARF